MCVSTSKAADAKTGRRILRECNIVSPTRCGGLSASGIAEEAIRKIIDREKRTTNAFSFLFFKHNYLIYASVFICVMVGVCRCNRDTVIFHADGD